ncbi:MAG: methionine adenosyltransferase [Bacilli bacterium]|nr:methionine adenosyltransferase [Bacilli bacterium]
MKKYMTCESVTEGHPDKVCDKIADSILDEYLRQDENSHVACEVITIGKSIKVFGEVKSYANVDINNIVKMTIKEIGYIGYDDIDIMLNTQSPDISIGVRNDEGAGDQGMMYGYATNETIEYMPAPIMFAHKLTKQLEDIRKIEKVEFIKPDGKAQVTVEYCNNGILRIDNVVVSTQHTEDIKIEDLRLYIMENVIKKVLPNNLLDENTKYYINPTGRFVIGGPEADSGLTGRKIIVDTYGGVDHHGGDAFSGKDPSKVDRSVTYMTRYIAKNIVAAGYADKIEIALSYVIGVSEPTSINIDTFGTGKVEDEFILKTIKEVFPLTLKGIIECLDLRKPIYHLTTNYGHFGKEGLSWEKLDKVVLLEERLRTFGLSTADSIGQYFDNY